MSHSRREKLFAMIQEDSSIVCASAFSSALMIDRMGIIKAQQQAINKALWKLLWECIERHNQADHDIKKTKYSKSAMHNLIQKFFP